jgi:hypothetical protein
MGSTHPPRESDREALNERVRRIGVGATVDVEYPPTCDEVESVGCVIARDRTPPWMVRTLQAQERSLVLDTGESDLSILLGFEPSHADSLPRIHRRDRRGIGVWDVTVVDRGLQVVSSTEAAELFGEVGRYGGA